MRLLLVACFLLFPCLALAEIPTTFGSMTFGQPPEEGMVCIVGPCSTEQLRPDIKQSKIDWSIYKKSSDITIYGGWEISSPEYSFIEGRFAKVSFFIECEKSQALRCMEEVADALDQEYGLELLKNVVIEESEDQSFEGQVYKAGEDTLIKFSFENSSRRPTMPLLAIEAHSMMEKMRKTVNPNYKPKRLDKI